MDTLINASELLEVIKEYTKAYADNKCEVLLTADNEVLVFYDGGNSYTKANLDDFNTVFDMVDFLIESMRKGVK